MIISDLSQFEIVTEAPSIVGGACPIPASILAGLPPEMVELIPYSIKTGELQLETSSSSSISRA